MLADRHCSTCDHPLITLTGLDTAVCLRCGDVSLEVTGQPAEEVTAILARELCVAIETIADLERHIPPSLREGESDA
jgi:hypothetical protein